MRKQLLMVLVAGALAGCGGSGSRSASSTGGGGGTGSTGTGGVAAAGDMATRPGSDGGTSAPGSDGGVTVPVADGGTATLDGGASGDAGTGAPPCPTTPLTLGTSAHPSAVAADSHYVYWLNYDVPVTIWRVPPGGGTPELVATDSYSTIDDPSGAVVPYMAADDDGVYWGSTAYPGGQSAGVSHIFALRPSGTVDTLATGALVEDLVLFDSTIFFLDRYGAYAVPTAGGSKQTVYSSFSNRDEGSLIADAAHLFVQENGSIVRVDRTSGASIVLGSFDGVALTVDFNRAYSLAAGVVYAVPPATGLQLSPANPSGIGGRFLHRDGTNLYYGGPNGDLSRLGSDGSDYTELAPTATAAVIAGNSIVYSHGTEVSIVCK